MRSQDSTPLFDWQIRIERAIRWPELERLQALCLQDVELNPNRAHLLCFEPEPTFTAGISSNPKDLLWSKEEQERRGISSQIATRGGQWTYHGPGQIVLFPILRLDEFGYDRRAVYRFMKDLRSWTESYLASLKLVTELHDRPFGIYAEGKKLASFGMAVQRGISSHGVALYLSEQSEFFRGIHPCGVSTGLVTSLKELGVEVSWEAVAFQMIETVKRGLKSKKKSLGC